MTINNLTNIICYNIIIVFIIRVHLTIRIWTKVFIFYILYNVCIISIHIVRYLLLKNREIFLYSYKNGLPICQRIGCRRTTRKIRNRILRLCTYNVFHISTHSNSLHCRYYQCFIACTHVSYIIRPIAVTEICTYSLTITF